MSWKKPGMTDAPTKRIIGLAIAMAQTLWSFDKSGNIEGGDHNWPLVPKLGNP